MESGGGGSGWLEVGGVEKRMKETCDKSFLGKCFPVQVMYLYILICLFNMRFIIQYIGV